MSRTTTTIGALLLCVVVVVHHGFIAAANNAIFTRVIETRLPNPVSLVMGSDLYTLSLSRPALTNQSLRVNSTSGVDCKLRVDPFVDEVQGRINAVAIEGQRRIAVWGIQRVIHDENNTRSTYYTLLIVDPLGCEYDVVPLPADESPGHWPLIQPRVVSLDLAYFVFYPSQRQCNPCLYSVWTRKDPYWHYEMERHGGSPRAGRFFAEAYDFSYRYNNLFYAYNFDNGTSLLEISDMTLFKYSRQVLLNTTVDAAAVSYNGSDPHTVICSISASDRREVNCMRLNELILSIEKSWKLPVKEGLPVADVSVEVDKAGNSFVGVLYPRALRCFVYNVDGRLVADLDFGELDERYAHRELNRFKLGHKEFCLVAVVYSDRNAQDSRHVVKCVDVSEYVGAANIRRTVVSV